MNKKYWLMHSRRIDSRGIVSICKTIRKTKDVNPKRINRGGVLGYSSSSIPNLAPTGGGAQEQEKDKEMLSKANEEIDETIKFLSRTEKVTERRMVDSCGDIDAPNDDDELREKKLLCLGIEFVRAAQCDNIWQIQEFVENDFPINFQHPRTYHTALHAALAHSSRNSIDYLNSIEKVDYLLADRHGRLPLDLAYEFTKIAHVYEAVLKKTLRYAYEQGREKDVIVPHENFALPDNLRK